MNYRIRSDDTGQTWMSLDGEHWWKVSKWADITQSQRLDAPLDSAREYLLESLELAQVEKPLRVGIAIDRLAQAHIRRGRKPLTPLCISRADEANRHDRTWVLGSYGMPWQRECSPVGWKCICPPPSRERGGTAGGATSRIPRDF